jgi:hypothetical protein
MRVIAAFLSGMTTMGFIVASLFFLRFWRRTGERLFCAFGIAFCLFALNDGLLALSGIPREEQTWLYILRLAGFGILIAAILAKNLGGRRSGSA